MYAEDVNYWKTGKRSPDALIDMAKKEIENVGGEILTSGNLTEHQTGNCGFFIHFNLNGDSFAIKWPTLKSKNGEEVAERRQAATALYHEVKAACVKEKFLGSRTAFFSYLMLPDNTTVAEAGDHELRKQLPILLKGLNTPLIIEGGF